MSNQDFYEELAARMGFLPAPPPDATYAMPAGGRPWSEEDPDATGPMPAVTPSAAPDPAPDVEPEGLTPFELTPFERAVLARLDRIEALLRREAPHA